MFTDPIADLLTRIRNAQKARKETIEIPHSKQKEAILKVLNEHQYIQKFEVIKTGKFPILKLTLNPKLNNLHIKRISKPGQRIYIKSKENYPILRGLGMSVISTSQGIMTDRNARKNRLGGEILFEVY